jgi:hypoxanthine phosphoribosyltransferase
MIFEGEVDRVLIPEDIIKSRVEQLGREISFAYRGKSPVVVGILKGSFVFLADLIRSIDIPITMDFMGVESYTGALSSGTVTVTHDLGAEIRGRHVLLVEDIVDTGLTLLRLREMLSEREPESLAICALLEKRGSEQIDVELTYTGFRIPDVYVVGYGLDYNGNYRNLPYIGIRE